MKIRLIEHYYPNLPGDIVETDSETGEYLIGVGIAASCPQDDPVEATEATEPTKVKATKAK